MFEFHFTAVYQVLQELKSHINVFCSLVESTMTTKLNTSHVVIIYTLLYVDIKFLQQAIELDVRFLQLCKPATYCASAVESVIDFCFFLDQLIGPPPMRKI